MVVNLSTLSSAVGDVGRIINIRKRSSNDISGVLLRYRGGLLELCYTDGKAAIIRKVAVLDATENDKSVFEKDVVLIYDRLVNMLDICKPYGGVKSENLELLFNSETKEILAHTLKANIVQTHDGTEISNEVSSVEQRISFEHAGDSIRFGLLSRMDYDAIFAATQPQVSEVSGGVLSYEDMLGSMQQGTEAHSQQQLEGDYDLWEASVLREKLLNTMIDENAIYVSANTHNCFTIGRLYVVNTECPQCQRYSFTCSQAIAKALTAVLADTRLDYVRIHVDSKRYVNLTDTSGLLGIWFEIVGASAYDATALANFTSMEYDSHRLVFMREALLDAFACVNKSRTDKTRLLFIQEGSAAEVSGPTKIGVGTKLLRLALAESASSISVQFDVKLEGQSSEAIHWDTLAALRVYANHKAVFEMLKHCSSDYVAMDLQVDGEDKLYMRIADITRDAESGDVQISNCQYTTLFSNL